MTEPRTRVEIEVTTSDARIRLPENTQPTPPALAELRDLLDAPPLTSPQAQGDVFVLPWPPSTLPSLRERRVADATPVPAAGRAVDPVHAPRHDITPATPTSPPPWYVRVNDTSHTLGVLVVPDGTAATLAHPEHADLHIGPGVYILHGQRTWTPARTVPAAD